MRHWQTKPYRVLLAAAIVPALVAAARADRIRTEAGIGYTGEIVGVAEGGLVVKEGNRRRTVTFAGIRQIRADKYPDLKKA